MPGWRVYGILLCYSVDLSEMDLITHTDSQCTLPLIDHFVTLIDPSDRVTETITWTFPCVGLAVSSLLSPTVSLARPLSLQMLAHRWRMNLSGSHQSW